MSTLNFIILSFVIIMLVSVIKVFIEDEIAWKRLKKKEKFLNLNLKK
jgi:hypothetical protein